MTKFIDIKCPSCGGVLQHKLGNTWHCSFCDTDSLFVADAEDDTEKLSIEVRKGDHSRTFSAVKKIIINAVYRKRTTLADKYPMDLTLNIDGRNITAVEEFENIGKGSIIIEVRTSNVFFYSEGKTHFTLNDKEISEGNLTPGDVFRMSSITILIK